MDITPDVITAFRGFSPVFFSTETWPDNLAESFLCDADAETGGSGWGSYDDVCGNFKQRGLFLYAAHSLLSSYPDGYLSNRVYVDSKSQVSSKSVGDESASFNVAVPKTSGDQWLESTAYGQQFARLRKRAGMGAITA